MKTITLIPCGIPECSRFAMNAAILGTQRFCIVPAMSNLQVALPLVRYNVCEQHLNSVRSNFSEVYHDGQSEDYSNVAAFV